MNERIIRIKKEAVQLADAIAKIKTFGTDYSEMTEEQQYTLGSYLNLMSSSTQLLVNPILGLQAKFTEKDLNKFIAAKKCTIVKKNVTIFLANLLYKIPMDDKDKKLIWKSFRKNKKMLEALNIEKHDLEFSVFEIVCDALRYKG